jgi:hypothetical protein
MSGYVYIGEGSSGYTFATYWEAISSASGTVTLPAGASVKLDAFQDLEDAVASTIVSGLPDFNAAVDGSGNRVVATFDISGNYTLSPTPVSYPVALMYRVVIPENQIDWNSANIVLEDTHRPSSGGGIDGPVSSTNNALARWNGTNGDILKDSVFIVDNSGNATTVGEITAKLGTSAAIPLGLAANRSAITGLLTGGVLSINADPTKFDIASGSGIVVDKWTNPASPTYTSVSWNSFTAQTVPNISTQNITGVGIDSAGAIALFDVADFDTAKRDYIMLGFLIHPNLTTISNVNNAGTNVAYNMGDLALDLALAVGSINLSGNVYGANGANLNINKSTGTAFSVGVNAKTDKKYPNTVSSASATATPFFYSYRDGSGGFTAVAASSIAPNSYDDGSGTLATVNNNKWSIQRIHAAATFTVIEYGQAQYDTKAEALVAINTEFFDSNPDVATLLLRSYLVVKKGTTALNDIDDAEFIEAGRFGSGTASQTTSSTTNLQQAYDNSQTPEIITDSVRGALTIERGSAADTDNILEGKNGAGSTTFALSGAGVVTTALTASRAVATGTTSELVASSTTSTELGYVSGVTSAIQTQLNSKQASGSYITALTGDVTASGPGSTAATVAFVGGSSAASVNTAVGQAAAALPSASFTDSAVTGKLITGYSSGAGTVAGTDTILQAINKLNGNDGLNLKISNNLSDLNNAGTARTNLGLGTLATQSGTFSGASSGTNTGDQTITLTGAVTGSGTGSFATTLASGIDATKIADGSVTSTEFQYINTLSSNAQTQLNAKAPTASPTFTGTVTTPLTASRALTTGASSELAVSATTAVELGYVSGVTSAIQTQLNAKGTSNYSDPLTTRGDLLYRNASITTRLPLGTSGYVLSSDGTDVTWIPLAGGGDMTLASVQTVTGAKTFGTIGGAVDKFILAGSTSGSSILNAAAVAGSTTFTLPGTSGTIITTGDTGSVTDTMLAGSINLTTKVTGTLPIANGGTNNASLGVTNGGAVYADGSKLATTAAGTSGQALVSAGAGAPTWKNLELVNANTADVLANAADTYLSGSNLAIGGKLKAGTILRWVFAATKTAAGVATPVWNVRFGTAGTTADTGRLTFTTSAQTAATDTGLFELTVTVRSVSASGVVAGTHITHHHQATTGFGNVARPQIFNVTSGAFDNSGGTLQVGVSVNPGASGVWTFQVVTAEAINLA